MFTHSSEGFTRLSAGVVVIITGALALSGCGLIPGSGPTSPATPGGSAPGGYGYYGSTPENTTQSSGTGGKTQLSVEALPASQYYVDPTQEAGTWVFIIEGHPVMQAGVQFWLDQHKGDVCGDQVVTKDIALITTCQTTTGHPSVVNRHGAISASGSAMTLSDFFYDSANYIDYINRNLLNEATNPAYAEWLNAIASGSVTTTPPVGFTGFPNDYPNFYAWIDDSGLTLFFIFPDGNPFLAPDTRYDDGVSYQSSEWEMSLRIPSDLSPFGRIAATTWKTTATGAVYPEVITNSADASVDRKLNDRIAQLATTHPELTCFLLEAGRGRVALVGVESGDCATDGINAMPHPLGQWQFGTWADGAMSVADLPADWRTARDGDVPTTSGAMVCPAHRTTDDACSFVQYQPRVPAFSSQARVEHVWANTYGLMAIVADGDKEYAVGY